MTAVFQRPLALLSSSRFDPIIPGTIKAFAQALALPLIDLDAPELPLFTLAINEEVYAQYVQNYVKLPDTPEKPFWSVVASEIISDSKPLGARSMRD